MRCRKARGLYFKNRDGLLGELGRMRLQEHLEGCAECASFTGEMERSLALTGELDELEPSENFEWNFKRRIMQEKALIMRRGEKFIFGGWRWGFKFVGAAVAAMAVIMACLFFLVQDEREERREPGLASAGQAASTGRGFVPQGSGMISFTGTGYSFDRSAAMRGSYGADRGLGILVETPFKSVADLERDSLAEKNRMLTRRIGDLEKENYVLRRLLNQCRSQSLSP